MEVIKIRDNGNNITDTHGINPVIQFETLCGFNIQYGKDCDDYKIYSFADDEITCPSCLEVIKECKEYGV